jgi:hypothetical protein
VDWDRLPVLLGWCSLLNLAVLLWWASLLLFARDRVYRLHCRWFELTRAQFDAIHYAGLALYKILWLMFNLTPYLALRLI